MTIWKFPIRITDAQRVAMPRHSRLLSFQVQDGTPILWALVRPDMDSVDRDLHVVGTGNPAAHVCMMPHIGTIQRDGFVWHLFDGGERERR